MSKRVYQVRKTLIEKNISILMNDGLGVVLEFTDFDEVSKICQILNANSDNNCRYEIQVVNEKPKQR